MGEMVRSLSKRRFTAAVRRLVPEIERGRPRTRARGRSRPGDRGRRPAGRRLRVSSVGRALHVLNAPSPAATASLEIGAAIVDRLELGDG